MGVIVFQIVKTSCVFFCLTGGYVWIVGWTNLQKRNEWSIPIWFILRQTPTILAEPTFVDRPVTFYGLEWQI